MKADIVNASLASIDANPFRMTNEYPYVEAKIQALMRSIEDVGVWEGIIVRKKGNRYQLAFGHHRAEAARRLGMARIPLIVRELSDEEMLQFMGRENLEDYNASFNCMLETWEAALRFYPEFSGETGSAVKIATLLGWTSRHSKSGTAQINDTARACSAAASLIADGFITRASLDGLDVKAAQCIVERAVVRMKQIDESGRRNNTPAREIAAAKKHVAAAAKHVARQAVEGKIAGKDLRNKVDETAFRRANATQKQTPLFAVFSDSLAEQIHKMLTKDSAAEKLAQIVESLPNVTMDEDRVAIRRVDFALAELEHQAAAWRKKLARRGAKVVPYLQLVKEG